MSIRFGISMTCFSFANVLRARKFFWICDAMMGGSPYAEVRRLAPAAGRPAEGLVDGAVPRAEKRRRTRSAERSRRPERRREEPRREEPRRPEPRRAEKRSRP